jgi:hypothetical protein
VDVYLGREDARAEFLSKMIIQLAVCSVKYRAEVTKRVDRRVMTIP